MRCSVSPLREKVSAGAQSTLRVACSMRSESPSRDCSRWARSPDLVASTERRGWKEHFSAPPLSRAESRRVRSWQKANGTRQHHRREGTRFGSEKRTQVYLKRRPAYNV